MSDKDLVAAFLANGGKVVKVPEGKKTENTFKDSDAAEERFYRELEIATADRIASGR